jgi:hypothetical protein
MLGRMRRRGAVEPGHRVKAALDAMSVAIEAAARAGVSDAGREI